MAQATVKQLSFDKPLTINDLRRAIPVYGKTITPIIQSEPGCGKSSLLAMIAEDFGDEWRKAGDNFADDKYDYIYVDCPCKTIPDIGMSIPVHDSKSLEFYAAELFMLHSKKPKVIMLDEMMKSPKMLQIMFTRLMLERMAGDRHIPFGSIVFATSNNESDNVGDGMLAHAGNRVMKLSMMKPDARQWLVWAGANGIARSIRAWVAMNSRCLASYRDAGQEDNPYIFRPNNGVLSFVSPRSLAKADVVAENREKLGNYITEAALAGTIGASAAGDMAAFFVLEKEVIPTKEVIANPLSVAMPEKPAALFMMIFNALDDIQTQDDLTGFMQFVNRISSDEVRTIFFTILMGNPRTMKIGKNNEQVKTWAKDNIQLLG
jgi:hypothetical protein